MPCLLRTILLNMYIISQIFVYSSKLLLPSFLANWKGYTVYFTVYPMTVNLHKAPPPPQKGEQSCVSDVSIF
jgi:hypothetical protein